MGRSRMKVAVIVVLACVALAAAKPSSKTSSLKEMLSRLEEQKALVSKKEKLVNMMMSFRPTNNRARAFGMKAMKQLQDDEENSGSGSGMFWADLAWFCDYLLYDVCQGDEECYMEYFNWYEEFSGDFSASGSGYNAGSGDNSGFDFSGSGWDWLSMFFQERKGASKTNAKEFMSALKKLANN